MFSEVGRRQTIVREAGLRRGCDTRVNHVSEKEGDTCRKESWGGQRLGSGWVNDVYNLIYLLRFIKTLRISRVVPIFWPLQCLIATCPSTLFFPRDSIISLPTQMHFFFFFFLLLNYWIKIFFSYYYYLQINCFFI